MAFGAFAGTGSAAPKSKYYDLSKVPEPTITGAEIIAGLEEFVTMFPLRSQGTPTNVAASEFLEDEARANGFKTNILRLPSGSVVPGQETVRVVRAIKKGTTKPDEWIVFGAHYDIVPGLMATVQGAYDNGAGTNMLRFFGKVFGKMKTNRSIVLLWFDGEENGLLGSAVYAEQLLQEGQKIHAMLGLDMVGIGYPAPYCICIFHGQNFPRDLKALPIIDYVNFDYLDFPKGNGGTGAQETTLGLGQGHVCSCGPNPRTSDERSFATRGFFTMRWSGMKAAADYLGYHQPWDTVPFMEATARGRANLEQGTENTFLSVYYTTFVLDNLKKI